MLSRTRIAREIDVPPSTLRLWEHEGFLPVFGTVSERLYRERANMIAGARSRLSMRALRRALAVGGDSLVGAKEGKP